MTNAQIKKIEKVLDMNTVNVIAKTRMEKPFLEKVDYFIKNNIQCNKNWFKANAATGGKDVNSISLTVWLAMAVQAVNKKLVDNDSLKSFKTEAKQRGLLIA